MIAPGPPPRPRHAPRRLPAAATAALLLAVLHHDLWLWNDPRLVLGFVPAGLAYHAAFSLAASLLSLWVVLYASPAEPDDPPPHRERGSRSP